MSIFTRIISSAALCSLALSSAVVAQSSSASLEQSVEHRTGAALSDSDLRRLNHYSSQTLDALIAFGAAPEPAGAMDTLRQKVHRLTDAGLRSGLNIATTADYFSAFTAENTVAPLPNAFLDTAGQFDAVTLLSSVELYYQNTAPQTFDPAATDEADMAAISSVAQPRPQSSEPVSQSLSVSVIEEPTVEPAGPAIPANAAADVRAILERVRLKEDRWVITVETGDSLGRYANALYGDTRLFQRIFEANINILITPNSIAVGQELVLPKS